MYAATEEARVMAAAYVVVMATMLTSNKNSCKDVGSSCNNGDSRGKGKGDGNGGSNSNGDGNADGDGNGDSKQNGDRISVNISN